MVDHITYPANYWYSHGLISYLSKDWQLVLYICEYPPAINQVSLKPELPVYLRYSLSEPPSVVPMCSESIYRSLIEGIWLVFNNKKNINPESLTIRNLSSEIQGATFSDLKFSNSTVNLGNNKANYWCAERLKYMLGICHYPKSDFAISKKDVLNSLNNNLSKKSL